jgi:hypothetical protein
VELLSYGVVAFISGTTAARRCRDVFDVYLSQPKFFVEAATTLLSMNFFIPVVEKNPPSRLSGVRLRAPGRVHCCLRIFLSWCLACSAN